MMSTKPTFLILDGNALLHRAWHALPPLTTKNGKVVNAAYGFAMVLEKLLAEFKPAYMAVAWDLPGKTFRHEQFEVYKAHREKQPQELYDQIPLIQDLLTIYGIPSISAKGFEADDVIGTLAKKAGVKKVLTGIVTGDLDALQLIDKTTSVIFFQKGISETKTYDADAVVERYGLTPEQLIDYKALRGDPSDNLPGVPGIGEKGATELLKTYGTLDGILAALKSGTLADKYAKKLTGHEATAETMRVLVTVVRDVPLSFSFADAHVNAPDMDRLLALYRDLDFKSLLRKHAAEVPPPPKQEPAVKAAAKSVMVRELPALENCLETMKTEIIGVLCADQPADLFGSTLAAIAISDGTRTCVVPNPLPGHFDLIFSWLKKAERVVTHDLKRFMHNTKHRLDAKAIDVMLASYLLHSSSRSHDLPAIAYEHFKIKLADTPASFATEKEYAALGASAAVLPKVAEQLLRELERTGMQNVFADIEMPLVPLLFEMESAGVELDTEALAVLSKKVIKRIGELTEKITHLAGEPFNLNSPSQLATILFEKLKLPTKGIKHTTTSYSTAASELEKLTSAHPIIPLIGDYRELTKLQSTYVEALPALVQKDGRVHTSYNQAVAATGRLSSSNPNLQNIPVKTDLGNEIRKAFVAPKGKRLIAADYSQIELRIVAVLAKDQPFITAFQEGADIHTRTASEVWGVAEVNVTSEQRRAAKAINFGIVYGMGPRSLARSTGMSYEEAQGFIDRYFQIHNAIRTYLDETKVSAHQHGFVETMFGRRREFPEINSSMPQLVAAAERMAVNMPVQGTAADLMKMAMPAVDGWLKKSGWPARMLLQVHDELVIEVAEEAVPAVARGIKEMMESVAQFSVPLVVDVEVGKNWGEMESL